ncbi:hypothetical protein EMPS_00436 [Entomortierella parvispora]|uniref:Protein kinase domain-containing protein n=1 Tax=Entomortierella parvispora TaxID=205924 RepID=A0A9P3H125_9FUNG|nr:hypothetical protein EMPS_00436 [Entomortierella parvispora]
MRIQWEDLTTFDTIGSGSFGRVFHGDLLGTEVAIKECVRSESKAFDDKYFKREVNILRQSRHPNIVQFMGVCKRKKRFYIITEFLPLGNLRRWIQDETKEFGWDTRISFAIDISLALAYLHHKNIIHRDLKGENLLISDNMRIKVCDFGFSRVEARNDSEMRRISYCGTDGYMAPEILLGEDFDCSVDVFSFGIVLSEMMARHVVDAQHFQRYPPDMTVSPDEILYRSQPGCPLELSELAINCVQGLPEDRPKLRQIVERLTAIENIDVHVGTTLVVAPSVARAARNMMRKKEAAAKNHLQDTQGRNDVYPSDLQPQQQLSVQGYNNNSSIQGVANTWRMTDEENAYSTSRRTESRLVGSQSTFKVKRQWKDRGSSTAPLVAGNQQTQEINGETPEVALLRRDASDTSLESEDGLTFRMPLWDSINSPENQDRLRRWQESESVHVSTIDGPGTAMQSWDRDSLPIRKLRSTERNVEESGVRPRRSHIRDGYRGEDDFEDGSESDDDILSDEYDDDGVDSLLYDDDDDGDVGRMEGTTGTYELSSDSDGSISVESLTDSVVMALDMLEIPDLLMASLPQPHSQPQKVSASDDAEVGMREFLRNTTLAPEPAESEAPPSTLNRQPSLTSRILPPIPASQNPWGSTENSDKGGLGGLESAIHESDPLGDNIEDAAAVPPTPPAKTSSLLVRVNTWRSNRENRDELQEITGALKEGEDRERQSRRQLSPPATGSQFSPSPSSLSPASSSTSSSSRELKSTAATSQSTSPRNGTGASHGGGRGLGLVRGMSDSFWSLRSTSPPPSTTELEAAGVVIGSSPLALSTSPHGSVRGGGLFERGGAVITDTIAAAATTMTISAKTWNNSTNGFAQWIGQYANMPLDESLEPKDEPTATAVAVDRESISPLAAQRVKTSLLKRHLSLKEGKQRPEQRQGPSDQGSMPQDESQHPQPLIRRRNTTSTSKKTGSTATSTGFPHRFSLVMFSTQLLPKCDVCEKRIGVLPGWSSKHLECDDCGYRTHPKCVANVAKCCTSARKSGLWEIPV